MKRLALGLVLLLAGPGAVAQVFDALAQLLRSPHSREPTAEEADRFWALARSQTRLTHLPSDESLPALGGSYRSVAVCLAGGARTFPLLDNGIVRSIKEKASRARRQMNGQRRLVCSLVHAAPQVIDALGANRTDVFYVLDTTNSSPPGKGLCWGGDGQAMTRRSFGTSALSPAIPSARRRAVQLLACRLAACVRDSPRQALRAGPVAATWHPQAVALQRPGVFCNARTSAQACADLLPFAPSVREDTEGVSGGEAVSRTTDR